MTQPELRLRARWARLSVGARVGAIGLAAMMVLALGITLYPTPVDRGMRGAVLGVLDALHSFGVPESFGYLELEFTANILMFVPLGFFFALLVQRRWWLALAFPLVLSVAIETAQFLLLPERFADVSDVVANTLGGWIGVGVAALVGMAIGGPSRSKRPPAEPDVIVQNTSL